VLREYSLLGCAAKRFRGSTSALKHLQALLW